MWGGPSSSSSLPSSSSSSSSYPFFHIYIGAISSICQYWRLFIGIISLIPFPWESYLSGRTLSLLTSPRAAPARLVREGLQLFQWPDGSWKILIFLPHKMQMIISCQNRPACRAIIALSRSKGGIPCIGNRCLDDRFSKNIYFTFFFLVWLSYVGQNWPIYLHPISPSPSVSPWQPWPFFASCKALSGVQMFR